MKLIDNTNLKLLVYQNMRMKIKKKHLPEPATIMNNHFKAYDTGFDKLDHRSQKEIICLTCKVMPTVQKAWKLYVPWGTKSPANYSVVSASDEAFGMFYSCTTS